MVNHPHRRPGVRGYVPSPHEIASARTARRMTQTGAAELLYKGLRTWQQWESGERRMDPALWELFLIKAAATERAADPPGASRAGGQ